MKDVFLKYHSTYWTIDYPANWTFEKHEGGVSFFADAGVGALQVSAYLKDAEVTKKDLDELVKDEVPQNSPIHNIKIEKFIGLSTEFKYEDHLWQMWFLMRNNLLLYVTYNCEFEDKDLETEKIKQIVNSLQWRNQG